MAEGVEHERCAETLRSLGVEWAQGWYFGRPGELTPSENLAGPPTGVAARSR